VVADNPDEIHGSALACAALLAAEGRASIVTMTTRDRNRIALESDALGASALGVSGILCLSGNHQSLGVCPQAAGANDVDSVQFTKAVKALDLPDMVLGATAQPYLQPMELNLLRLKKKIAAGADFVLTQPIFDVAKFSLWLDAVRAAGLDTEIAIIASVLPLTSPEKAEMLRQRQTYGPLDQSVVDQVSNAADPANEGLALAIAAAAQVKGMPGVRGIHILSGGCEALVGDIVQAAKLA
jgi:methylenetetrahydrofolate reductase (NADPH)